MAVWTGERHNLCPAEYLSSALPPKDAYWALRSGCIWYLGIKDGRGEDPLCPVGEQCQGVILTQ